MISIESSGPHCIRSYTKSWFLEIETDKFKSIPISSPFFPTHVRADGLQWQLMITWDKPVLKKTDHEWDVHVSNLMPRLRCVRNDCLGGGAPEVSAVIFPLREDGSRSKESVHIDKFQPVVGMSEVPIFSMNIFLKLNNDFDPIISPKFQMKIGCEMFVSMPTDDSVFLDLEKRMLDKKHSDVVIKVGDHSFPAHKVILSARSQVFDAMFECHTKEQHTNVVEVTDTDPDTMEAFLRFMYTGTVPNINNCQLMLLADKYDVKQLHHLVKGELLNTLTTDNVTDVLVISNLQPACADLKMAATDFLVANFEEVRQKPEWKEARKEHPDLFDDIMSEVVKKIGQR